MKFVWLNFIPILLIALAAYLIYLNRDGWGWCVFGAVLCVLYPPDTVSNDNDVDN
jgi:hypothetical protein